MKIAVGHAIHAVVVGCSGSISSTGGAIATDAVGDVRGHVDRGCVKHGRAFGAQALDVQGRDSKHAYREYDQRDHGLHQREAGLLMIY